VLLLSTIPQALGRISVVLRALAEGKIRWAFSPPGPNVETTVDRSGDGIWIKDLGTAGQDSDEDVEGSSDDNESVHPDVENGDEDIGSEMEESVSREEDQVVEKVGGRFALLVVDSDSAESGRTSDEDSS
jgi:hypothetical protein